MLTDTPTNCFKSSHPAQNLLMSSHATAAWSSVRRVFTSMLTVTPPGAFMPTRSTAMVQFDASGQAGSSHCKVLPKSLNAHSPPHMPQSTRNVAMVIISILISTFATKEEFSLRGDTRLKSMYGLTLSFPFGIRLTSPVVLPSLVFLDVPNSKLTMAAVAPGSLSVTLKCTWALVGRRLCSATSSSPGSSGPCSIIVSSNASSMRWKRLDPLWAKSLPFCERDTGACISRCTNGMASSEPELPNHGSRKPRISITCPGLSQL
mmetsp:Transcript_24181/g.56299  ORF Transcript_24181/g.56299 Transcript_24181/m.56299 type:complete len:262 (-) Transcript_24181:148-933(-)